MHILSNGRFFSLAVVCTIAVKKDIGLNKYDKQTDLGIYHISVQLKY